MNKFNFRQNLIVPNVSNMMGLVPFETDMLVLMKSGLAYGFEIKISKSDLKADFKKPQYTNINKLSYDGRSGIERYYGKFKYFFYAVPEHLKDDAIELIPKRFGILCLKKWADGTAIRTILDEVRKPQKLYNYTWSQQERYGVARLGAMRIYDLKRALL